MSCLVGGVEFVNRGFQRAVFVVFDIYEAFGAYLLRLDEIRELVELLAGVCRTAFAYYASDIRRIVKHLELAGGEDLFQFLKLHAETQVGLVRAVFSHGFVPCHLPQLPGQLNAAHLFEEMPRHVLEEFDDVFLIDKRHLAVYLRELRLAVGPQILVAKTFRNLEIAVEARHHQQLLQCLRRLRQGIELSGIHARRHDEVACSLGCRTDEDRCLNLDKLACVEEVAYENRHTVAKLKILAHRRTAQVEVSVFHSEFVAAVRLVFDCEWRRDALAYDVQFVYDKFDVAGGYLLVLGVAFGNSAYSLNDIFSAQFAGLGTQFVRRFFVEGQLCDAVTVT